MILTSPKNADNRFTTDEALGLLIDLVKRLFAHDMARLKETPIMRRFEKNLFAALNRLAMDPNGDLGDLTPGVQRLVYEMLTQYVTLYALSPGTLLSVTVSPQMSDEEKLSALIEQEIVHKSWPYPQSVPL